jgi:DNA-binding protein YbaB
MLDEFDLIVAAVNDTSKEIIEKQEVKQEQMYSQIEIVLQGVQ